MFHLQHKGSFSMLQSISWNAEFRKTMSAQNHSSRNGRRAQFTPHMSYVFNPYKQSGIYNLNHRKSYGSYIRTVRGIYYMGQSQSKVANHNRYLLETGSMAIANSLITGAELLCDLTTKEGLIQASIGYSAQGIIALQQERHKRLEL